jgi:heparosan-N-sulfate-glucuronate 5-epimerase
VAIGLGDGDVLAQYDAGVDSLARNLERYDAGFWSLYSLFPHPLRNVASSFYHALHVTQLQAMQQLSPRPEFAEMSQRWQRYADSVACQGRAAVAKGAFRVLVPRNRLLARRMPWTRM